MINPRDMTDHQLIAELQGWPPALADMKRFSWRQMGVRFKLVAEEFEDRMKTGHSVLAERPRLVHMQYPTFATKQEIEEEQERMQGVVKRLPDPNERRAQLRREELRCAFVELLSSEEGKRLIEEGLVEGLSFKRSLEDDAV